jgi:hypothetical protein
MALSNSKTLKTSVLSVTALAASSAWGKSGFGVNDGPRLGEDFLTLDELPIQNATLCLPADDPSKQFGGLSADNPSIVVDSSKGKTVKVSFIVSEMNATDEDRLLFLVYGTKTTPSPQILTTDKGPELGVALSDLEILGYYQIPALGVAAQDSTKVGRADPFPTNKMTVNINFDQSKIDEMLRLGKETIYVQAALIRLTDWQAGLWENMILSEMDSLTFVANECPADTVESYEADDGGNLGKSSI